MKMKGYKAFSHGMICRKGEYNEKQYAEHTTYEEEGGEICGAGMMHFCANPLDCLDYYGLIDDDGNLVEIAEVEAEDPVTDDNKKYASKKLHIGAKIDIKNLGSISAQVIRETVEKNVKDGNYDAQQLGGDYARQLGGKNSILVAGKGSEFKAGMNSIILHYWFDDNGDIGGFKATQVDGVNIKADTWYRLQDGEFVEV